MRLSISKNSVEMGQRAADKVTELIHAKIKSREKPNHGLHRAVAV